MPLTHTVGAERKRRRREDGPGADDIRGPTVVKACSVSSRSLHEPAVIHRVVCGQNEHFGLAEYLSYGLYATPEGLVGDIIPFGNHESAFREARRRRLASPRSPHVYAIIRLSLYDVPHEPGDYCLRDEDFLPALGQGDDSP